MSGFKNYGEKFFFLLKIDLIIFANGFGIKLNKKYIFVQCLRNLSSLKKLHDLVYVNNVFLKIAFNNISVLYQRLKEY